MTAISTFLTGLTGLVANLTTAWGPAVGHIAAAVVLTAFTVGFVALGTKMVRTARANARVRAARRAREAYRAPVLDLTERLATKRDIA